MSAKANTKPPVLLCALDAKVMTYLSADDLCLFRGLRSDVAWRSMATGTKGSLHMRIDDVEVTYEYEEG